MTRTVRRAIIELGYRVHTPPEVFGTRELSSGATDEEWLSKIAGSGWIVLNRDVHIMQRKEELAEYRKAAVHMFYLPGQATRDTLHRLVVENLRDVVTYATSRRPALWWITETGVSRIRL